jgi:protein SCO1/2
MKPHPFWRTRVPACISFLVLLGAIGGRAQSLSDEELARIQFEQKLNNQVSLDLHFRDETGRVVRLGDYFKSRPVVLVLGYYQCPMLCTLVLNGMVESAADMKWSIGREFDVVDLSINPRETPALAAAKKQSYLKRYGRSGAAEGWHFLTGDEPSIEQLAREVGFHYAYDTVSKEYAHASGLVVLTPEGKVSSYLFGVTYAPKDLSAALRTASTWQVGSPIQQLILLCFHYNPITGKYSQNIIRILRILGATTILGLVALVVAMVVRRPKAHIGAPNQIFQPAGEGTYSLGARRESDDHDPEVAPRHAVHIVSSADAVPSPHDAQKQASGSSL